MKDISKEVGLPLKEMDEKVKECWQPSMFNIFFDPIKENFLQCHSIYEEITSHLYGRCMFYMSLDAMIAQIEESKYDEWCRELDVGLREIQ